MAAASCTVSRATGNRPTATRVESLILSDQLEITACTEIVEPYPLDAPFPGLLPLL